jgi:hypothetical protein
VPLKTVEKIIVETHKDFGADTTSRYIANPGTYVGSQGVAKVTRI